MGEKPHGATIASSASRLRGGALHDSRRDDPPAEPPEPPVNRGGQVFSIGHSTHPLEKFLTLLEQHQVDAVADVRSQPYSRRCPQFNREGLRAALGAAGRSYVYIGDELGARPEDRGCYLDGKVQFELLGKTPSFRRGIARIVRGSAEHRVALMCAEKEPLHCHRTIIVSRHLVLEGIAVEHILADGSLESHSDAMSRLMSELGMAGHDLFRSRRELEDEAYARRGEEMAFVED